MRLNHAKKSIVTEGKYDAHDLTEQSTICIVDSGVGGTTILAEIQKLLPTYRYIYVFDNEAFPYGNKSTIFLIHRLEKIFAAIKKQHITLNMAVIACNTASTTALKALRKKFLFPIIGVVPAIKPAVMMTRNGIIGLLATPTTINSTYTHDLIKNYASNIKVELLAAPELVMMAEMKFRGEHIAINTLRQIFLPWLKLVNKPDTIVLGCTHFPILTDELASFLGNKIMLIDSAKAVAQHIMNNIAIKEKQPIEIFRQQCGDNKLYCTKKDNQVLSSLLLGYKKYHFQVIYELVL